MKIRTSKPSKGNKYYIRKANGGYSNAILGKPTDSECNVLANCVGYAYGRFNEIGGYGYCKYLAPVNAENFIQYKGSLEVGQIPKVGACMVWEGLGSLAGHVAIVEKVIDNNTVYTSESGYGSSAFWNSTRSNANGRWGLNTNYKFLGFIYNPAVKDEPVTPVDPFPGVSDEELARRVWTGEFGNNPGRKEKLGIRYSAVQALVDKGVGKPEEPKPEPVVKEINEGDTVIVNGVGTASSDGSGSRTRNFEGVAMKVIGISGNTTRPNRYALNQYNRGNVHDWSAVTAWFSKDSLSK